ncbi:MAG TPA: PilZ domain-containing protein [Deferrisomatales bacterium]|nr:PilZ domain-containing protein [Deferrisomatales bacterium]
MTDQHSDSGPNRRASPRSHMVVREARCIAGMDVFFGCATNVSRSGMFIATPKLRDADQEYEIQFHLPGGGREIRCRARVVWARHYRHGSPQAPGFGLQFIDLAPEDAAAIDAWVEEEGDQ